MLNDPTMLQLLQNAQTQQQQQQYAPPAPQMQMPALDQQSFDVGIANMDAFVDFSSAAFPNLDALLSEDAGVFAGLPPQPQQVQQQQQPGVDFSWNDLGFGLPAQA